MLFGGLVAKKPRDPNDEFWQRVVRKAREEEDAELVGSITPEEMAEAEALLREVDESQLEPMPQEQIDRIVRAAMRKKAVTDDPEPQEPSAP